MALNEKQIAKLERLKNHNTRHEFAASHPDGRKILIVYTVRSAARRNLVKYIQEKADAVVALTGAEEILFGKRKADGFKIGEWTFNFSGRTQREAIICGELPFILNLAKA